MTPVPQAFRTFSVGDGTKRLHGMSKVRRLEFCTNITLAQNRRTEAGLALQIALRLLSLASMIDSAWRLMKRAAVKKRLIRDEDALPTDRAALERMSASTLQSVRDWAQKSFERSMLPGLLEVGLSRSDARKVSQLAHAAEQIVLLLDQ